MAIIVKQVDFACDLIDAGARIAARLVDGRTPLHLAAQFDLVVVLRKLLERDAANKEQIVNAEKEKQRRKSSAKGEGGDERAPTAEKHDEDDVEIDSEHTSSDDDWSSEEAVKKASVTKAESANAPQDNGDIPEDENDIPDVLDINATDWDHAFTPLNYAILYGSLPAIEELLIAGADVKLVTEAQAVPLHPLTLTILIEDEDHACKVAERLLLAGASSSVADVDYEVRTIFYRVVCSKRTKLASTILRCDPTPCPDTCATVPQDAPWCSSP